MSRLTRVASFLLLLVVGWASGLAAVALHGMGWGLALAATATVATLLVLKPDWWSRLPFGLGWVFCVGTAVAMSGRGEILVAGDANGYALMALGLVVLVLSVVTGVRPRRVRQQGVGTPT